jgi:hypothetical protein
MPASACSERGRRDRGGQLSKAEPMPSEGSALLFHNPAGEFVSSVEGRPDDQHLLALTLAFQPDARPLESAVVCNGDDSSRAHHATVSAPNYEGN